MLRQNHEMQQPLLNTPRSSPSLSPAQIGRNLESLQEPVINRGYPEMRGEQPQAPLPQVMRNNPPVRLDNLEPAPRPVPHNCSCHLISAGIGATMGVCGPASVLEGVSVPVAMGWGILGAAAGVGAGAGCLAASCF